MAFDRGRGRDHVCRMTPCRLRLLSLVAAWALLPWGAASAATETCFGPLAGQSGFPVCAIGPASRTPASLAPATRTTEAAPISIPAPATEVPTRPAATGDGGTARSLAGSHAGGTMGWTTPQGDGAYHVLPDGGTVTSRRSGGPSTFHTYNDGTMGWTTPQGNGTYRVLPDGRTVTSRGGGPTVLHNYGGTDVDGPGRPATAPPPPGILERPRR